MFSRNDHITTKMGKLPPSPCQACGSRNHWDKECLDWEIYRARTALDHKSRHSTEKAEDEGDTLYQSAYGILLSQCLASSQIDLDRVKSDFEAAIHSDNLSKLKVEGNANECKSKGRRRVTVQEVEDESWLEARSKPKSSKHLLYNVNEEANEERPPKTKHPSAKVGDQSTMRDEEATDRQTNPEVFE